MSNHVKQQTPEDQDIKLDPSLLISKLQNLTEKNRITGKGQPQEMTMTLRRRGLASSSQCPSSINQETRVPLESTTYIPNFETCTRSRSPPPSLNRDIKNTFNEQSTIEHRLEDRIFSVTTSVVLFIALVSLIGLFCICACNRASLLVNAEYSALSQGSNNQQYNGRPQVNRQATTTNHPKSFSSAVSSPPLGDSSTPSSSASSRSKSNERHQKLDQHPHLSIDRFDSGGEQIRPPLLQQPTTLRPLTQNKAQQVSLSMNGDTNIQAAASQDSYLSPEDRDQLLRSQESHYEGKNSDQGAGSTGLDPSASERDMHDKPSNRWSQPETQQGSSYDGGGGDVVVGSRREGSQSADSSRPDALAATSGANEADEADYDDESGELGADQKRANLVPENRRVAVGMASYNNRRQLNNNPPPDDESDPNDDYNGANDDSHFSRKPSNNLNQAASHNRQHNRAGGDQSGESYDKESRQMHDNNNIGNNQEDSQGFGPGPNEAYLVDKSEYSGNNAGDSDDDASLYSPPDPSGRSDMSNVNDDADDSKFDRRLTTDQVRSPYANPPLNYGAHSSRPFAGIADNGADGASDNDPADDGSESAASDPDGPAFAPSSKSELKSRGHPLGMMQPQLQRRINSIQPKTSASAIAPSSAISPSSNSGTNQPNVAPVLLSTNQSKPTKPLVPASIRSAFPVAQGQQVHRHQQQTRQSGSIGGQQYKHAITDINVPYNPQNNPSHAGKYFIN